MTQERKQFQRTEDGHLLLMSNNERNLLITDLTARLNYGVICLIERVDDFGPMHRYEKLTGFCFEDGGYFHFKVGGGLAISFAEKIMPCLRPMSSMTEEEKKQFFKLKQMSVTIALPNVNRLKTEYIVDLDDDGDGLNNLYDWLNTHHFDYRGLIDKGLALEAPEGMYTNYNN